MSKVVILKVYKDGVVTEVKELDQDSIMIGSSSSEAHVVLPGDAAPVHASIEKRGGKYVLSDLGSESGTFKNGDKILEAELKNGDSITLGEFVIEFSVGAPSAKKPAGASASAAMSASGASKSTSKKKSGAGASFGAGGGMAGGSLGVGRAKSTFAPPSAHKNINEFVRPTKGTLVEVLVAWRERVISAYHFSERGTISVGTHPTCDVIVPLISTSVNKAPLIQLENQAIIILHPGMEGMLVSDKEAIPFADLAKKGRASGNYVPLQQGEMARINLGGEVELIVRYASQAPKPLLVPFFDLSSNGFLATILALLITGILALYVTLYNLDDKKEELDEDEFRTALIIANKPKPPPRPKITIQKKKKKVIKKRVKLSEKKVKKKKTQTRKRTKQKKKGGGKSGARGSNLKDPRPPRAMKARPGKISKETGSVKKGGSKKTSNKKNSQAQSERKLKKSGIFSAFGSGGANDRIDPSYSGAGGLAGLADNATGSSGFNEDRPGKGLGSKFKETGATGKGRSNVGVSGLSKSGSGLGGGGFGDSGLGDRKAVSIIPGGGGEEYSGQIDKEGIRKVFFDNARAIRSCYERQLIKNPNLGGKIMLDFDIGEHGRVVGRPKVKWSGSTMTSRAVANCVLLRLKTWRFPEPPRNQVVNVIYPLAFSAK